jgi:leucyl aminopeptidase
MNVKLVQNQSCITELEAGEASHILMIFPPGKSDIPLRGVLDDQLKRRKLELKSLASKPLVADLPTGGKASWVVFDLEKSAFERHTALRKAVLPLLEEHPATLVIAVFGKADERRQAAEAALYVAWLNSAELPSRKKKQDATPLKKIALFGRRDAQGYAGAHALAQGNTLARSLTMLPPNDLTPAIYRDKIRVLATGHGWKRQEYDLKKLRKLGAGAFVAVAQGSEAEDAA